MNMKAKLHKMESGYILSLNGDIDDPYAIVNEELAKDYEWYKLSLKNCQAIELGYDLDELVMGYDLYENINFVGQMRTYKAGFQKALEILGDKKFSEEDIKETIRIAQNIQIDEITHVLTEYKESQILQMLNRQFSEWDVEVEMICPHPEDTYVCGIQHGCDEDGCNHPNKIPFLDKDGCLILKRI